MTRLITIAVATAALVGASGSALADDPAPTNAPATENDNSLVLSKGKLQLNGFLDINLSSGEAFKPVSLSPDLWYGATDDVTVGLVHSAEGETGFIGPFGSSLCLTGSGDGCGHFYNNVGVDARIRLVRPWAVDVGLYVNSFSDPFQLAGKIGISGRWQWGKLALEAQPSLFIGFTNRNPPAPPVTTPPTPPSKANSETLFIPITVSYLVAPKFDLALQPGLVLPFSNTGDTWMIPVSIAGRYAATPRFGIGLAFSFLNLIGGTGSGADARSLTIGGTYAF